MAQLESKLLEIEIDPGKVSEISPLLRRVTAPNPSVMTGPGTNSYIVGRKELAVIDPGPSISSHVSALLSACDGAKVHWVIATHTHPDHSPAAKLLAEATGAELIGATIVDDGHQDTSFKPLKELQDGEVFCNDEYSLRAIHTPGHVGNHFCFFLEEEKALFTGDHIMQGTTVVVIPPSGDMAEYLHSLEKLKSLSADYLAPAHGHVMSDANAVIQGLIDHRMARESKVLGSFTRLAAGTLDQLLPFVYDDVDPKVLPVAKIALWSHLLKLETDGRAIKTSGESIDHEVWSLT